MEHMHTGSSTRTYGFARCFQQQPSSIYLRIYVHSYIVRGVAAAATGFTSGSGSSSSSNSSLRPSVCRSLLFCLPSFLPSFLGSSCNARFARSLASLSLSPLSPLSLSLSLCLFVDRSGRPPLQRRRPSCSVCRLGQSGARALVSPSVRPAEAASASFPCMAGGQVLKGIPHVE